MLTPVACLLMFVVGSQAAPATSEISKAEPMSLAVHAVAQRLQIQSGRVSLTSKSAVREAGKPALIDIESGVHGLTKATYLFDGASQRVDQKVRGVRMTGFSAPRDNSSDDERLVEIRSVLTPTGFITYMPGQAPLGGSDSVQTGGLAEADAIRPRFFPVSTLGMIPMPPSLWHSCSVDDFYRIDKRHSLSVSQEELAGVATTRLRYLRDDGKEVSIWFAPGMGGEVVQSEFSMTLSNGDVRSQVVRSWLKKFHDEIWFPERVEYTCHSGGELIEHEIVLTDGAELNVPIDKEAFTISGMNVAAGAIVVGLPPEVAPTGVKVWDGVKLDDTDTAKQVALNRPPIAKGNRPIVKWIVLGNVTAGVVFLALYFRHRKKSSSKI